MQSEETEHYFPLPVIIYTTGTWTLMYCTLQAVNNHSDEWNCRLATIFHAILVTALSVLDWSYLNPWTMEDLGLKNTEYEEFVLCITLGYFIFDFFWVLVHQTEGPLMYFHHLSSIISISYILKSNYSAREALLSLSILEGTNPCLQIRWFLRTGGYYGTWRHTITECVFVIAFILLRIVYGTYLTYSMITSPKLATTFKLGICSLYLVSLIFLYQMINYVYNKYFNKTKND